MPILRCPTCNRKVDPEKTQNMPFCSERCQLIDLGRWLDEEHGLPYEGDEQPEQSSRRQEAE